MENEKGLVTEHKSKIILVSSENIFLLNLETDKNVCTHPKDV